jgi:hypothetical protein
MAATAVVKPAIRVECKTPTVTSKIFKEGQTMKKKSECEYYSRYNHIVFAHH